MTASHHVVMQLEDIGFCEKGQGRKFVATATDFGCRQVAVEYRRLVSATTIRSTGA